MSVCQSIAFLPLRSSASDPDKHVFYNVHDKAVIRVKEPETHGVSLSHVFYFTSAFWGNQEMRSYTCLLTFLQQYLLLQLSYRYCNCRIVIAIVICCYSDCFLHANCYSSSCYSNLLPRSLTFSSEILSVVLEQLFWAFLPPCPSNTALSAQNHRCFHRE